jgi:hypothetical protein
MPILDILYSGEQRQTLVRPDNTNRPHREGKRRLADTARPT